MNIQSQNILNAPLSQKIAHAIPTPAAVLTAQSQLYEFSFDCNLRAAISVKAVSRTAAERHIRKVIDSASCNGGAWDNGDPALFEASINDNPLSLYAIDGDDVGEVDAPQTHVGALIDQVFSRVEPDEIDAVIARLMSVHPDADATRESFEDQMRGVGCIGESAVVRPEFTGANAPSVGSVQSLFSTALLADALVDWPAGSAASRLVTVKHVTHNADPAGASLFYDELTDAFETLGDIVGLHGLKTLTDLMCLQQSILVGTLIDVWPESSKVGQVLQSLPSSTRWLHYTVERN